MSFASFVGKVGDTISDGIRAFAYSSIPEKVGKVGGKMIGTTAKMAGNVGLAVGTRTVTAGAETIGFFQDNGKDILKGLKSFGLGAAKEANEWGQAGVGALGKFVDTFTTPTTLDRSILGRKFNKKGTALIMGGALAMSTGSEAKQYINARAGQNDGRLYGTTPTMSTPYMLSEQMAYSQHGRSFADNAGATGDLVFALNNMRNG